MRWLGLGATSVLLGCPGPATVKELRISELQTEGVFIDGQWLEIANLDPRDTQSLAGLTLTVDAMTIALPNVELLPGEAFVVGDDAASASIGVDLVEELMLDGSVLQLLDGDELLHEVEVDLLPQAVGSSVSRDPNSIDGPQAWCIAWESSTLDFGSPGMLNSSCRCSFRFDFAYLSTVDPEEDVTGNERITFTLERSGYLLADGSSGMYTRSADANGQSISWTYEGTGIRYSGTRGFGEEGFVDQPIEIPDDIAGFSDGRWSSVSTGDTLCDVL